jgi:predicted dehydrogenase
MTNSHLRYGIIGCGMMGREHIRNIKLLENTSITTICEPDQRMRQAAAELAPDAAFADDIASFVARDDIDVMVIASPNHLHMDQIEALVTRPRPLLVEKPLYTDPEQAKKLSAIKAHYSAPIWVAMEYRYMPAIQRLAEEIPATTGDLKMLTIREHRFPFLEKVGDWNRFNHNTGGTLVEKCCHFFDLMRLMTGSEAVRVMASAGQAVNHLEERYDGKTPDIWDHGFVIVDFDNGKRAMLELCMFAEGSRYQEKISAIGATGMVEAFVPGPTRFWPEDAGPAPVAELVISPRDIHGMRREAVDVDPALLEAGDHNGATFYQHERFAAAVRGGGPVEVSLDDGAKAVAIGLAAQKSAASGMAVALD